MTQLKSAGGSSVDSGRPASSLALRKRRVGDDIARVAFGSAAGLSVLISFGIVIALVIPSLGFFAQVNVFDFVFGDRWAPRFADASFGVLPLVSATLWTTVIALCVAVPLGLGAAILLAEYANPKLRRVLKPILEVLAGVPTVVYGLFALQFVQTAVLRDFSCTWPATCSVPTAPTTSATRWAWATSRRSSATSTTGSCRQASRPTS